MAASAGDLRRLIHRATPRFEDVRCPDRTDFLKKEHKDLTLREVVDALDGLDFAAGTFDRRMREVLADPTMTVQGETINTGVGVMPVSGPQTLASETAVHGLYRVLRSFRTLTPALPERIEGDATMKSAEEARDVAEGGNSDGWEEELQREKSAGAECFKTKDFKGAIEHYSAAIVAGRRGGSANAEGAALHALYSNRSAAFLQTGDAAAALEDARSCVHFASDWPKGHFRAGSCLRQLGRHSEAVVAFEMGRRLEPDNKDWEREIERTELLLEAQPSALVQQFLLNMAPEMLRAWRRGSTAGDEHVLQLQVIGELSELGAPKWRRIREKIPVAKAQVRFAHSRRKDYLANLTAVLQKPPTSGAVAVVDVSGAPLKIAEIVGFLDGARGQDVAIFHVDIKIDGRMCAVVGSMDYGEDMRKYIQEAKDPAPPKGSVEAVLQLQRDSGFPKALPRLLGFMAMPGDLNFPVVDLARDAPQAS